MARSALQASNVNDTGWVRVSGSSNVAKVRHIGAPINQLHIRFKAGGGGFYSDVPRDVFRRMVNAASKGKFVWRVLRNNGQDNVYPYTRM